MKRASIVGVDEQELTRCDRRGVGLRPLRAQRMHERGAVRLGRDDDDGVLQPKSGGDIGGDDPRQLAVGLVELHAMLRPWSSR